MKSWMGRFVGPLVVGSLVSCGGGPSPLNDGGAAETVAATVATADVVELPSTLQVVGSVAARHRVLPGSEVMGRVAEVLVDEGDRVARGQRLAVLEDEAFRAAVDAAVAGLAMAEAERANATRQRARMEELLSRGAVTAKSVEDAVAGDEIAAAAVEAAAAQLAAARDRLAETVVGSPADAWVAERRISRGDMVFPGTPLFVLDVAGELELVVEVPESLSGRIGPGAPVRYQVDAAGRSGEATVTRVVPAVDERSRTVRAEIALDGPPDGAQPGQFARVWLIGPSEPRLVVPVSAISRRGQLEALFVVGDDGVARRRLVRLGHSQQGRVEVLAGLAAGERYLVTPPLGLRDGARIAAEGGR